MSEEIDIRIKCIIKQVFSKICLIPALEVIYTCIYINKKTRMQADKSCTHKMGRSHAIFFFTAH